MATRIITGDYHHGITTMAIPILKSSSLLLKEMRQAVKAYEPDLTVIDLITATQTTKSYADYVHQYENTPIEHLRLFRFGAVWRE